MSAGTSKHLVDATQARSGRRDGRHRGGKLVELSVPKRRRFLGSVWWARLERLALPDCVAGEMNGDADAVEIAALVREVTTGLGATHATTVRQFPRAAVPVLTGLHTGADAKVPIRRGRFPWQRPLPSVGGGRIPIWPRIVVAPRVVEMMRV